MVADHDLCGHALWKVIEILVTLFFQFFVIVFNIMKVLAILQVKLFVIK